MWHLDRFSSFILLPLVDMFPSISVSQHAPLLNGSLSRYFPCFSKTYSPQRKGHTHTDRAHNLPKQNAWTGWHDPTCYTNHPSPTFPLLLITHTTTHGDTHAGCGSYDHRKKVLSVGPTAPAISGGATLKSRLADAIAPFFPPSSPESSSQNLCQGELIAFVALSQSWAGRNNEASANSKPLTTILTPWQWHFDFNFILNTLVQHTSGQ